MQPISGNTRKELRNFRTIPRGPCVIIDGSPSQVGTFPGKVTTSRSALSKLRACLEPRRELRTVDDYPGGPDIIVILPSIVGTFPRRRRQPHLQSDEQRHQLFATGSLRVHVSNFAKRASDIVRNSGRGLLDTYTPQAKHNTRDTTIYCHISGTTQRTTSSGSFLRLWWELFPNGSEFMFPKR